jgi:hypothetical protein
MDGPWMLVVTRPREKVWLTVDEGVLRAVEREAKRSKRTLSAEVTEALARELRRRYSSSLLGESLSDLCGPKPCPTGSNIIVGTNDDDIIVDTHGNDCIFGGE